MLHLTIADRELIYTCIQAGHSNAQIAREVCVHRSTIGRELKRNGGRENYNPRQAEQAAKERQREAMPKRNTIGIGMSLFTTLEEHNAFYPYLSKTHEKLSFLEMFILHPYDWTYENPSELRNRDIIKAPIRLSPDFSSGGCAPLNEPEHKPKERTSGSPAVIFLEDESETQKVSSSFLIEPNHPVSQTALVSKTVKEFQIDGTLRMAVDLKASKGNSYAQFMLLLSVKAIKFPTNLKMMDKQEVGMTMSGFFLC